MDIKRFYAIQCRKFLALFLSLVCLVTTVLSPSIVLADNDMYVFKPEYTKIQGLMDYVMSGVMGVFPGDFNTFYQNNKEAYDKWYEKVYGYNYSGSDHSGGGRELTVKADDMKELYDLSKSSITALYGYYILTPASSLDAYLSSLGYSDSAIASIYSYGVSNVCFVNIRSGLVLVHPINNFVYNTFNDNGYIKYISSQGSELVTYNDIYAFLDSSRSDPWNTSGTGGLQFNDALSWTFVGNSPMRIFYSYDDFLRWKNQGKSNIYFSSIFYNYSPQDITINSEMVKNYTENNTTKKIYNETVNNINQSGGSSGESGLTQDQVQKIVDDAVQKVLDAMPTPTPEPTDTPTPTPTPGTGTETDTPTPTPTPGGDSGGTPDSSAKEFFQRICDYFEENNKKLEDIINLLDTAGKSDCNYNYSELSEFLSTLWNESDKKFDTMISLLERITHIKKKCLIPLIKLRLCLWSIPCLMYLKTVQPKQQIKLKKNFPLLFLGMLL